MQDDPLWFKDAVIYELHVRAFCDSISDGHGDFGGLTEKLDYIQDLGVTAIWLLPFYPSPLRDDGYDISNYTDIHPQYGKLKDFEEFLSQAHLRGLRVITELVINHTSDQHQWFQRARLAPRGSSERDFYVWSDAPDKFSDARIIFKDFETSNWTYDRVADAYYWHRFYSHQPDLNYDNPEVRAAILPLMDFWFEMGVDGLRLDAIPYLFEREGTNCENLPETHEYLKSLRRHVDETFPNRMLLAEANQWPEDAVSYFGDGDECHMAFHFPLMPRLFMAMHMEDRFPVVEILDQTPVIPDSCQWAMFLRNHDELTLEMVTDEERDYMYRAYAHDREARVNLGIRRRLAPLLGNSRRSIELMNGLLFSLMGTPFIYYGDEIGMGDNIYLGDRNGVRTPMQWNADRNAGFSRANSQKLYLPIIVDPEYHYEAVNVKAQQGNPNSLLWWMKRLIGQRRQHKAFSRGTLDFLQPENRRILAFIRRYEDEQVLVVANLSRFVQYVELDLSKYAGFTPIELFGCTSFPRITTAPYVLTMGPHSFYWFSLSERETLEICQIAPTSAPRIPEIWAGPDWELAFADSASNRLVFALRRHLEQSRNTASRRVLMDVRLREIVRVPYDAACAYLVLIDVEFNDGAADTLLLPIAFASTAEMANWIPGTEPKVIAAILGTQTGVLYSATRCQDFNAAILHAFTQNLHLRGSEGGEVVCWQSSQFRNLRGDDTEVLAPTLNRLEQTNVSIRFGNRLILKAYRRIEEGVHPELDLAAFLSDEHHFPCVAPLAGAIEYRQRRREPMVLAVLHGFVPNEGDAWQYTLDVLSSFFEHVATRPPLDSPPVSPRQRPLARQWPEPPEIARELLSGYLDMVRLLGRRLAELHGTLAIDVDRADFAPEAFTQQYQRGIFQAMRNVSFEAMRDLERQRETLPAQTAARARQVLQLQEKIQADFQVLNERRIHAARIRCHGDCHLHQILFTGKDFVFIDFEGRPGQSVGERRIKRSPLRDVVSLVRSFDYAANAALFGLASGRGRAAGVVRPEDRQALVPWAIAWRGWTSDALLRSYFQASADANVLPADEFQLNLLFRVLLIEKLLLEISYELENRPSWLDIPLSGMLDVFNVDDLPDVPFDVRRFSES